MKWKAFFQDLELLHGLNVNSSAHIWLLHYLFLEAINDDALDWAEAWNRHTISIQGDRNRSPRDLFFFGMVEHGTRGFENDHISDSDIHSYGVDWQDFDDPNILAHHRQFNGVDEFGDNPFITNGPDDLSVVEVDEPNCPLSLEQIADLGEELDQFPLISSRTMDSRQLVWIRALEICATMFS
jgi:hypothetical protein